MIRPFAVRRSPAQSASRQPAVRQSIGTLNVLRLFAIPVTILAGCTDNSSQGPLPPVAVDASRPSVALRVLVVNNAALAGSLTRLRGEWEELSGGTLSAETKPWSELAAAQSVDADVVLLPARHLGEWCEHDWLRPLRSNVVSGSEYHADDVLPLVRQKLCHFNGREMALPLGVQLPLFGYRADWLAATGGLPPNSWADYSQSVARAGALTRTWPAREEVENWLAIMLMARAAAYARHPLEESILFDSQTMAPRIAAAPFVRALEEWQREAAQVSSPPNSGPQSNEATDARGEAVVWSELPGAEQVFSRSNGQWELVDRGPQHVTFLADGWLAAVTTSSRNATTAFRLAGWLASAEIGSQLASPGLAVLPCRRSQLAALGRWTGLAVGPAGSSQFGTAFSSAVGRANPLVVPRVPGVDEYLAALTAAVANALEGQQSPSHALQEAERQWDEITNRHGRVAQLRAYQHHLGIAEP